VPVLVMMYSHRWFC